MLDILNKMSPIRRIIIMHCHAIIYTVKVTNEFPAPHLCIPKHPDMINFDSHRVLSC